MQNMSATLTLPKPLSKFLLTELGCELPQKMFQQMHAQMETEQLYVRFTIETGELHDLIKALKAAQEKIATPKKRACSDATVILQAYLKQLELVQSC